MNKTKIILILVATTLFLTLINSCTPDTSNFSSLVTETQMTPVKTVSKKNHKWFYFTYDGFKPTVLPQMAPQVLLKPWTEAIRISSSLTIGTDAFLTVNKLGLLVCDTQNENKATLSTDNQIFSGLTVDNMTQIDGFPVFHVYKNAEFNQSIDEDTNHPFLVQYHPDSSLFMPLLYADDLDVSDDIEVSDIIYDNSQWTATLKSSDKNKTNFDYISFTSHQNLIDIEPAKRKDFIQKTEISEGEYRSKAIPQDFSQAPDRLKNLLSRLPENFGYYVQCATPNRGIQDGYIQQNADNRMMESNVLLTDNYSIAIFTDGTGFFSGALDDKYILNNGNPIAFRLPKLPQNFSYGTIIVENNTLYVAWEESVFYEIGRTGFLTVDLDKVFYSE